MFLRRILGLPEEEPTVEAELEDVARNITLLLGSRRGAAWFEEEFGIEVSGARNPEQLLLQLQQQVTENLERYEPRVSIDDFDEHHDTSPVQLEVTCSLKRSGDRFRIMVGPGIQPKFDLLPPLEED